ncbi:MAG: putative holin-like toxin [Clostridium sp.]|nr:putative holin-like toxin [Clostridium sp.]
MPEYIGREVALMTGADIILIFIGIIGLLIAFGSFVIALLAFLDRDKDHKRKK